MFTLRDYQQTAVDLLMEHKHLLFKASTGAGKTVCAVEGMRAAGTEINVIIAPLNTYKGWRDTLARQEMGTLRAIDNLKAGKQALLDLVGGVPGYYFLGYEKARTLHWANIRVDFVVLDEIHRTANHKSLTFRMMKTLRHAEYMLGMSATPAGNKPSGLFGVANVLWQKPFGHESFWKFCSTYLKEEFDPFAFRNTRYTSERNPGQIMKDLPAVYQVDKSFKGELAVHQVEVKLNPTQRRIYNELLEDSITFLEDNPLITELPSTKYLRLMETTLAEPSVTYGVDEEGEPTTHVFFKDDAKSSKADAVVEILGDLNAEHPEPVLIFTHSRKYADFLTQRLNSKGYRTREFVGGLKTQERTELIEEFGKSYEVLVATISSISEGTDGLQHVCANEIWVSVSDQHILNLQAKGRIHRNGQERLVNRYYVRATDTIELGKQEPRLAATAKHLEETYENA